jgi:hypothetical protein
MPLLPHEVSDIEAVPHPSSQSTQFPNSVSSNFMHAIFACRNASVTDELLSIYASAMNLMDNGWKHHPEIFVEVFKQLDTITQARRIRLHLSTGIVPGLLWLVLYSGAVLTVGFTFFFGTKNLPAQVMMTGILSLIVFMGLLVIVSIDHPFTGPVHVGAEPLQTVIEDFDHV